MELAFDSLNFCDVLFLSKPIIVGCVRPLLVFSCHSIYLGNICIILVIVCLCDIILCSFDEAFDEVIYPKGEPDAVSISKRDVELLQPQAFINDTIIDFYIK